MNELYDTMDFFNKIGLRTDIYKYADGHHAALTITSYDGEVLHIYYNDCRLMTPDQINKWLMEV